MFPTTLTTIHKESSFNVKQVTSVAEAYSPDPHSPMGVNILLSTPCLIAAFLDVEKALDNVWHNGLRYKIYQLDLPTKLCRWLSDFLVARVKIEGFLSPKVYPKAGVPQGSNLSPLLFLIYVNDMPNPSQHKTNKSQFADDAGQWAVSKNIDLAAEYLQRDLDRLAR